MDEAERARRSLRDHLRREGIRDPRVLEAIARVPRERFVLPEHAAEAYADTALPIGGAQTISQPYVVARMTELLETRPEHRVLEVGTGSGYQAAVLALLVREVVSVERHAELAESARRALAALGIANVTIVVGDGSGGYADGAPYDRIIVTAAAPRLPEPLERQCAVGGKIVAPIGDRELQRLVVFSRDDGMRVREVEGVRFVPLIGEHGFEEDA